LDRAEVYPAKKKKTSARPSRSDRREAEQRRGRRRWRRRRMEDHFEYIVEAVRIVLPEGTRQLNVRCSRH
jgi:ribosome-binding protein aMBF1 (putative translation factor)